MLLVLGDQLSHVSLSTESKILLSERHKKFSHVKFYASGKAGGGKPLMLKLLHSNSISDNAQAALYG